MNFKENAGVDPVTLSKGYTKLDGNPPHSGENILKPAHVESDVALMVEDKSEGFLVRDYPTPFDRPNRGSDVDRG